MARGTYRQPNIAGHKPHTPYPNKQWEVCEVDGQGWPCLSAMLGQPRPVHRYGLRQYASQVEVERALRKALPDGMAEGVLLTIEFVIGFETFGHYESWGRGFRVTDQAGSGAYYEHLDDALIAWQQAVHAKPTGEASDG